MKWDGNTRDLPEHSIDERFHRYVGDSVLHRFVLWFVYRRYGHFGNSVRLLQSMFDFV